MLAATRRSSVYAARGLSRVFQDFSISTCQQHPRSDPSNLFNFRTPFYSTNAPAQLTEKPSKDAVPGNLWVPNQFPGGYVALDTYGVDLTELARHGIIDRVIGRDDEIEQCIRILSEKTKNNPIIVGETSVGKTTIAEGTLFLVGIKLWWLHKLSSDCWQREVETLFTYFIIRSIFLVDKLPDFCCTSLLYVPITQLLYCTLFICRLAQKISRGDVPESLKNRQFYSVDIGSLLIAAMHTGKFEESIKHVIREVTASDGQIILFIDEIQTVVGAVKEVIRTRRQRSCVICMELVNINHIMRLKSLDICSTLLCLRSNFLWQILATLGSNQHDCSENSQKQNED